MGPFKGQEGLSCISEVGSLSLDAFAIKASLTHPHLYRSSHPHPGDAFYRVTVQQKVLTRCDP